MAKRPRHVWLAVLAVLAVMPPATAATKATKHKHVQRTHHAAGAPQSSGISALVVDADSGKVLYEKNAGQTRYPASLTKMMTLYLTFEALNSGKLALNDALPVSEKAAAQPQTNIALKPGMSVPLLTLIKSVVIRSANDSAMVLAERLGGSEWNFALMMTQKARQLGMKDTVFRNPNGLPDNRQYTTAYDMARLGIALRRDYPRFYHYFSDTAFDFNGKTYVGHNHLLGKYPGVDGVKTGFIRASGFNLVTSVRRNGYNIVAVVLGGSSAASRDQQMVALLDKTFATLPAKRVSAAAQQPLMAANQ